MPNEIPHDVFNALSKARSSLISRGYNPELQEIRDLTAVIIKYEVVDPPLLEARKQVSKRSGEGFITKVMSGIEDQSNAVQNAYDDIRLGIRIGREQGLIEMLKVCKDKIEGSNSDMCKTAMGAYQNCYNALERIQIGEYM